MPAAVRTACPLCGSGALAPLPIPRLGSSMLSDGRVFARSLDRKACDECGAAFLAMAPEAGEVARWFREGYGLAAAAPQATAVRAQAYQRWIREAIGDQRPVRILEVGAGSGALLRSLSEAFPDATLVGCEPSAARASHLGEHITLYAGDLASIPLGHGADLALAVNVIEHLADPGEFLHDLAARLGAQGEIVIVCPDGECANMELVFFDHVFSFTTRAISHCATRVGLAVTHAKRAPAAIGDFRLFRIRASRSASATSPSAGSACADLLGQRANYLRAWQQLDSQLERRLASASGVAAFGAGQMAALLRAYAPRTWELFRHLEVDQPADAWPLGKPVVGYGPSGQATLVLAVAPKIQDTLARRLERDRRRTVRFDDLIPR